MPDNPKTNAWRVPKIWPAAASGLMVVLCFPPFRLALLVFAALVPLLLYLQKCDGKRAFRSGLMFGFVFWLGELSFIAKFVAHWTGGWVTGLVPYLLGCLVGCIYFGLFGWVANVCYRRRLPWLVPVVWAGVEVFRSYVYALAFPFGLLASPLIGAPSIVQTAHYGSIFLVSAWIVLANVGIAEVMSGKGYRELRWAGAVFLLVLGASLLRYSTEPTGTFRTVVAGQIGEDMAFGNPENQEARIGRAVDALSALAKGSDLLVLPEGITRAGDGLPPPIPFHVDPSLPVVFGGQRGVKPSYQSAFSYDGHWDYADKTRLVIFGEYVPFREYLPFGDAFKLPAGDLVPASTIRTVTVGKFKVGAALCFEALFPDVPYRQAANGANIIAVMSIDDWYFGTNAPEQLRDASNWRAIETGLPVVRAASLGYSIVVDQRGRTVAEAPLYNPTALIARVQVPDRADVFPLLPVFPYLSLASLLVIPVYDWVRRRAISSMSVETAA